MQRWERRDWLAKYLEALLAENLLDLAAELEAAVAADIRRRLADDIRGGVEVKLDRHGSSIAVRLEPDDPELAEIIDLRVGDALSELAARSSRRSRGECWDAIYDVTDPLRPRLEAKVSEAFRARADEPEVAEFCNWIDSLRGSIPAIEWARESGKDLLGPEAEEILYSESYWAAVAVLRERSAGEVLARNAGRQRSAQPRTVGSGVTR